MKIVQGGHERLDSLAFLEPAEEDEPTDAFASARVLRRAAVDGRAREIRRDDGMLDLPSARAHPVEHVGARADDDIRQLDGGTLEGLELE